MIAQEIGTLLLEQNYTITTAESCTAGLLSSAIAEVPGASEWFLGGWVTYSNVLKMSELGVSKVLLDNYGAVSSDVATAMAQGASEASGSNVALSTTGIAGPTGGSDEKPVGTVFIGCKVQDVIQVREFRFLGLRNEVQQLATQAAIEMLRLQLICKHVDTLSWQHGEVLHVD